MTHRDWIAALAVVTALGLVGGCGDDDDGAASTAGEGAGQGTTKQASLRTEDGYEVVLADPSGMRGPQASKQGDLAEQRRRERLVLEPTSPDPEGGEFTLEQAVADMPVDGQLVAELNTDLGSIFCDLFAEKAPAHVANFIGLARGIRPWWDPAAGDWVERNYYRRTTFHRVIPEYLIQAGDHVGDGSGGTGYQLEPEHHDSLSHDSIGVLSMADDNAGQFFLTDGRRPELDGDYTVFGKCRPEEVVSRIARVPQSGGPDHSPLTPVQINRVLIRRVSGGAQNATITVPEPPPGYDPQMPGGPGRSKGPSELRNQVEERRRLREQMGGHEGHGH